MSAVSLSDLTQSLLKAAQDAGADAADALAVDGTSLSIGVREGKLEEAERAEGVDIGLRVLIGKQQACVSASDISADTIAAMAERAVAMAREAPEDPDIGLADPADLASAWDLDALDLADSAEEPAPDHLRDLALRCEEAALARTGISQVSSSSGTYSHRRMHLAASNGFSGGYTRTGTGLSCVAITGEGTGMERDYFGDMRVYASDLLSPEEIGQTAADRTLARAGARQPQTGTFPVLFDERISSTLIGHLLGAVNGSTVARGGSWLRDAMDEAVLPDGIDLVEDPLRARGMASRPFDAEGLATRRRNIVENGVLKGWTLDLASARKLGLSSTASAARGPSSPPSPTVTNVELTQGQHSPAELMARMGTGLLVTGLIGATINPTTGDYSRGASGMWIENGEPAYPVNECTIAGNLRDMLRRIVPANDARTHLSRVVPSLLIEEMTLAGA